MGTTSESKLRPIFRDLLESFARCHAPHLVPPGASAAGAVATVLREVFAEKEVAIDYRNINEVPSASGARRVLSWLDYRTVSRTVS